MENIEIRDLGIDVPAWITPDITVGQLEAVRQGGCDSGAYMPAVTYSTARETMGEHGDDVLEFIEDQTGGGLPSIRKGESWSGIAVLFLSAAVELWASSIEREVEDRLDDLDGWEVKWCHADRRYVALCEGEERADGVTMREAWRRVIDLVDSAED